MKQKLPPNYHRDWQRRRMVERPELYAASKLRRSEQRREKKRKAIEYMSGKCADCSGVFQWWVYDFHHVDPTTKSSKIKNRATNSLLMLRWETIAAELDKCVLLCANCHRTRHAIEDGNA